MCDDGAVWQPQLDTDTGLIDALPVPCTRCDGSGWV